LWYSGGRDMNMKRKYFFTTIIISLLLCASLVIPYFVFADRGMVPYPPRVILDETEQNAIVGWNGKEEVLILSTDVRTSEDASVLEILPLPSNPTKVEEGSLETFENLVERINQKITDYWGSRTPLSEGAKTAGQSGVEITFHEQIGAHNITVAKVNDLDQFIVWVENYLIDNGLEYYELSTEFKSTVADYLKRNIRFFVFDLVEASTASKSLKPIVYRFPTNHLFYPMEITAFSDAGGTDSSEVNLFLITKKKINPQTIYKLNLTPERGFDYPINFSQQDLTYVNSEIAGLFSSGARVYQARYYGRLNLLDRDFVIAELVKTAESPKVYQIMETKKHWVSSLVVFNERRFNWTDVEVIEQEDLDDYQTIDLVRAVGDYKVYHLTESGLKRHVPSVEVFNSYGYKWENVKEVSATECNAYSESILIRAEGEHKVYKLENGKKRWIKTVRAFNRSKFNWNEIASVNTIELNAYSEGVVIE